MGVVARTENILKAMSVFTRKTLVSYGEIKNIVKKKGLWSRIELSEEQEKEIQDFFKCHYGKCFSTKWHRLYQSYTGTYCYDYFPEILFSSKLEPITNPYREAAFFGDKNLLPEIWGGYRSYTSQKRMLLV